MNKKILLLAGLAGVWWWLKDKYQKQENYLISDSNNENENAFRKVGYVVRGELMNTFSKTEINASLFPSLRLLNFLKNYESLKLQPYFATKKEKEKGIKTIGYGHVIKPNEDYLLNGISKEEAEKIFAKDVSEHAEQIYSQIKVQLNQQQFDALVSFCFNLGAYCLSNKAKGMRDQINSGDYEKSGDRFLKYVYQDGEVLKGLYVRRYSEMKIWRFGIYERWNG